VVFDYWFVSILKSAVSKGEPVKRITVEEVAGAGIATSFTVQQLFAKSSRELCQARRSAL
ncbi:MAG: hypothetical protein RLZZ551_861, partial [Actinomycetota bacterium]